MSDAQFRQLSHFKGKRQRGVRQSAPKEFSIHCMVADDLRRFCAPDWRWTHFPAGEARTAATGARLKRMGTQAGWPDFILLDPDGRFYGLELKRRGNTLSDTQLAFRAWCWSHDVRYAVADSYHEAVAVLKIWGVLPQSVIPQGRAA
jgi:hypothetical protein